VRSSISSATTAEPRIRASSGIVLWTISIQPTSKAGTGSPSASET
jgi:hypothetical protein